MTRKARSMRFEIPGTRSQRVGILPRLSDTAVAALAQDTAKPPRVVVVVNAPLGRIWHLQSAQRANTIEYREGGAGLLLLLGRHLPALECSQAVVEGAGITAAIASNALAASGRNTNALPLERVVTLHPGNVAPAHWVSFHTTILQFEGRQIN